MMSLIISFVLRFMMNNFAIEWQVLQNQYDSYEKFSLLIKLLTVVLFMLGLFFNISLFYLLITIMVLWLQDAIWKTFQSRIEAHLLRIEQQLSDEHNKDNSLVAFQFNREFLKSRHSTLGLCLEYVKQALRPTIAYPYVVLIITTFIHWLIIR